MAIKTILTSKSRHLVSYNDVLFMKLCLPTSFKGTVRGFHFAIRYSWLIFNNSSENTLDRINNIHVF